MQLIYQVCYTRYQVSFYLWWIGSVLKYCKLPKYYDQDCSSLEVICMVMPFRLCFSGSAIFHFPLIFLNNCIQYWWESIQFFKNTVGSTNHLVWRSFLWKQRKPGIILNYLKLLNLSFLFYDIKSLHATGLFLYTPWKYQKNSGFLMFSGGTERNQRHEKA